MTAPATAAIEAQGLGVRIKRASLLDGIELSIEPGEWVSVIGPNGAGKSTLLRAIAGVIRSSGSLDVHGRPVGELDARSRSQLISWVPQVPTIPPGIAVFDYVLLGRTPHLHPLAREKKRDLGIVGEVLEELDLAALARRSVDTLSGGELQRAVIGRALAQRAPIILLDEPTSALDLGHQQEVLALLHRLRSEGERTIVTTMHDLTLAGLFADRLVLLAGGRLVATGPAAEVLTESNLENHYGARVTVTHRSGQVLVTPQFDAVSTEAGSA